jgi:hypothetical protein
LLKTLYIGLLLFKTSYLIIGFITPLRIKYIKRLSLKKKVIELDKIKRAGDRNYFNNSNLRLLRDILIVYRLRIISYNILRTTTGLRIALITK